MVQWQRRKEEEVGEGVEMRKKVDKGEGQEQDV